MKLGDQCRSRVACAVCIVLEQVGTTMDLDLVYFRGLANDRVVTWVSIFQDFLSTLITIKYCKASALSLNRVHLNTLILSFSLPAISL
jgi:hypothetical protein